MILNNSTSEVTCIGDLQKNQVSIDAKNINHIVTILSSNLYSNPKESFLRETISNAIDSHKEAGVKEPVIITIKSDSLAIRDYGTGISPERFKDIYLNIGSSTKRESNDYIGSFGIGRFSALSVSNLVNITSYYEGKAYQYLMVKDVTSLNIDLLNVIDTDEHNGVEVKIPVTISQANAYIKLLTTLCYFKNIYINVEDKNLDTYYCKTFNERKIYDFTYFSNCDIIDVKNLIRIGDVLYPLNADYYPLEAQRALREVQIKFNIGDLDITPNRENILYSERSIRKIKEVMEKAKQEILEVTKAKYSKDYDDFFEFVFNNYFRTNKELIFGKVITLDKYFEVSDSTYKGKSINFNSLAVKNLLYHITYQDLPITTIWENAALHRGRHIKNSLFRCLAGRWGYSYCKDKLPTIIRIPSASGFTGKYLSDYLFEKYGRQKVVFILDHTLREVLRLIDYSKNAKENREDCKTIVRGLIDAFTTYSSYLDLSTSEEYKTFKKEQLKLSKQNVVKEKTTTWYISKNVDNYSYTHSKSFKNIISLLNYVRQYENYRGKMILKAVRDDIRINDMVIVYPNKYIILAVAETNKKQLSLLPSWIRDIDEVFNIDNKSIRKILTAQFYLKNINMLRLITSNEDMQNAMINLADYTGKGTEVRRLICKANSRKIVSFNEETLQKLELDEEITEAVETVKKLYAIVIKMKNLYAYMGANELFAYIAMKHKLLRIKASPYFKVKHLIKL